MKFTLSGIYLSTFITYVLSFTQEEIEIFHNNLIELTDQILNKYFFDYQCIIMATEQELFRSYHTDLNITIMHISPRKDICDHSIVKSLAEGFKHKCNGYIIQLSDPICFLKLWLKALHTVVNRHVPKFLFLPSGPDNSDNYVDDLFSTKESDVSAYIVAVEVDTNSTDWPITLWTNDYSLPADTPGREKLLLDKWSLTKGFLYNNDLFYDKIINLNGRVIKVMTFTYPSYSVVVDEHTLEGTEGQMFMTFCKIHNCSFQVTYDGNLWGFLDTTNGSAIGIIGYVYKRKVELGYAGLYQWPDVNYHLDYSTSWLMGVINVLVPKPVPLSAWKTPILPFDWQLWLATFASWIFTTFTFFTISSLAIKVHGFLLNIARIGKLKRFTATIMAVLGVLLLQSPPQYLLPKITSIRVVFICTELLALILTSCYSAELASYLTLPQYSKPIDTVQELADSNLIWIAENEIYNFSLQNTGEKLADKLASTLRVYHDEELLKNVESGKYGVAVEVLPGGTVVESPHLTSKMITNSHTMKEHLYGSPIALMFNKASPYVQHFNNLLNRLLDTGIITFWEEDATRKYMSVRKQLEFKESRGVHSENVVKKLTVGHIQGTFFIYATGMVGALFTFLYEIYYFHKKQNKPKINVFIA